MTTAAEVWNELAALGVTLAGDGDRLRFHPRDRVTGELLARLRTHKGELLAMLQPGRPGNGYTTQGTTGQTGVVSPAVPQDLQPHGDAAGPVAASSGSQPLPGGDPLGADGPQDGDAGDWQEYITTDGRRGWVRLDVAGLEYHDLPSPGAQRLQDEARRLRARCPVTAADLQPQAAAPVRTWPPVVPSGIIAAPVIICGGCGRLRVVPGQPGRPFGLCFGCWSKRR